MTSVGSVCRALFVVGLIALTGCTADPKGTGGDDPLEPLNRAVFATNDVLDQLGFRPAALAYNKGVPAVVRISLRNILLWLNSPVILSNDLLQGEVMNAVTTASRFLINSFSFGAADIAGTIGLPYRSANFSQTLGRYGIGGGPYLVLPLLGPSSLRDMAGTIADSVVNPITYIGAASVREPFSIGRTVLQGLQARADNFDRIDQLRANSIDYYASLRAIYLQRHAAVTNRDFDPSEPVQLEDPDEFDKMEGEMELNGTSSGSVVR